MVVAGHPKVPGLEGILIVGPAPPTPFNLQPEMLEQQAEAFNNPQAAEFVARTVLKAGNSSDEACLGVMFMLKSHGELMG